LSDKTLDEVRMVDSESWTRNLPTPLLREEEAEVVMDWEAAGARMVAGGAWSIVMNREVLARVVEGETKAEAVTVMATRARRR